MDFISLSEAVDTSTPMGKMIFTVLGAVTELERSLIRERVVMRLNRARKGGKRPGRPRVRDARQAAYDLRKLRAKNLLIKLGRSRRYCIPPEAVRTITALVILREKVLRPILAGVGKRRMGRKPKTWSLIDQHYEMIRQDMFTLFRDLRIAA